MRDHDAASDYQRYVDRFFLLGSRHSQTIRLNHVVIDAIVATQTGGGDQSHQLFVLRGQSAFEVGVVIQVIETLDEEVVGLVHVFVEAGARVQKVASDFAFFGNLLLGELVGWFFAVSGRVVGGLELLRSLLSWLADQMGSELFAGIANELPLYRMLVFGLALVVVMVLRPRGMVSTRTPTVLLSPSGRT